MSRRLIFISSVQKELQLERIAMRDFIRGDALLRKQFDVFLFEELPASDRKADDVYLEMVEKCDVYVGIFGNEYGKPNSNGMSPTEQEYQLARDKAKYRIILVKGTEDSARNERMAALIHKAQNELIRKRFSDPSELIALLYASLVDYLEQQHVITSDPFDAALNMEASADDIDSKKVAWFLKKAREERNYPLSENTPPIDTLLHLNLMHQDRLKNSALLLFAKQPQRFFIQAETKCLHYHGTIVAKPIPSYQIFKGTVFDQVDAAVDFVLSKLNRSVTPKNNSPSSAVEYEIPYKAIREAIVNAVAHRDYTSNAAVQVLVLADRVEVWNPGALPAGLLPESLRKSHSSIPKNPMLADPLYLTHYIEKAGSGTLDMIALCTKAELPEPDFRQDGGQFVVTLWRDWLTDNVLASLNINDRQKKALRQMKISKRMNNTEYQNITGAIKKTASRDLDDLVKKKILVKSGTTGRGVIYELGKKRDIKGSKETSLKRTKREINLKGT
jgi:ATP-dependent DNA helicase RecG